MTDLRQIYNARMNRYFYIALICHLPIMLMAAYFFETSIRQALVFSLLILIGPSLAYFSNKESNLTASVMAVAGIFFSGLLIHLGKGMIEMHFHIFVFLATLTFGSLSSWRFEIVPEPRKQFESIHLILLCYFPLLTVRH